MRNPLTAGEIGARAAVRLDLWAELKDLAKWLDARDIIVIGATHRAEDGVIGSRNIELLDRRNNYASLGLDHMLVAFTEVLDRSDVRYTQQWIDESLRGHGLDTDPEIVQLELLDEAA